MYLGGLVRGLDLCVPSTVVLDGDIGEGPLSKLNQCPQLCRLSSNFVSYHHKVASIPLESGALMGCTP